MKPPRSLFPTLKMLAMASLITAFTAACSSHAKSTVVRAPGATETEAVEEFEADEFIGMPIMGDYDENPDLDFVLEVRDGQRTFKIEVHEDASDSNRELIDMIRKRVNEMEDQQDLRVIGYYSPEYRGKNKEYGFMDIKCIVFFDNATGYEEAYFTDPRQSQYYDSGDVTVIYAPGHHYRNVHYPRNCTPWWDTDGDGIPDRYDPWPMSYDIWYDYNLNGVPDWYDPYYCDYYPYWNNWNVGFWLSYNWYSPRYFRHGYAAHHYYHDYRKYTRLYDERHISPSHKNYHLDPKRDYHERTKYNRGSTVRATSTYASGGSGYDAIPVDRRRLVVPSSSDGSRARGSGTLATASSDTPRTFSRNRSATEPTASDAVVNYKRKASSSAPAASSRLRGTDPGGRTASAQPVRSSVSRSRTTSSSGDNRAYSPVSRSRTSGSAATSSSVTSDNTRRRTDSGRVTRPTTRSTSTDSRYRGSSRTRSSDSQAKPAAVSRSRTTSRSTPQPSASRPSSRSRSSAPAARSAPSRSRSSTPAARSSSSSSSSRSRSSAPAKSKSSSSGGDRRKR